MKDDARSSDLVNRAPHKTPPEPTREAEPTRQAPSSDEASTRPTSGPRRRGGADVPPVPEGVDLPAGQKPRKTWKVFAALGAGCLAVNLIIGGLVTGLLAFGMTSCVSSCSDNPIGDSREAAAFIADRTATTRDLETFDALRGVFEALHDSLQRGVTEDEGFLSVDELRAEVAAGSWPKDPVAYGGTGSSLSPQLWVRLAELAQDHLVNETGERWEVVDVSYPFPSNGPVPFPAFRDEESAVFTRLLCADGEDKGLCATVAYYRWTAPARFETDLEEAREKARQRRESCARLEDAGLLEGRRYVLADGDLYVWERGEDDPLRDKEAFLAFAGEAVGHLGDYAEVSLLAQDTPLYVRYNPLSYDYPNDRDPERMSFEEGRERLLRTGYPLELDHARGDVLLGIYTSSGGEIEEGRLRGMLSPRAYDDVHVPAMARGDECVFDQELCGVAAGELGVPDADVIVLNESDTTEYEGSEVGFADDMTSVWVLVPRGSVSETPEGFCEAINGLRNAFWSHLEVVDTHRTSIYVRLYVIDDAALVAPDGEACSFADLRDSMAQDCSTIRSYGIPVLLGAMSSGSQWAEDEEPTWYDVHPSDIGGTIAYSREWRYGETS